MATGVCEPSARWGVAFLDVVIPASHLTEALENPDAIQVAVELGRLDFVSSILAVLGILLGLAALLSFSYVLGAARKKAEDETKIYLQQNLSLVCLPHVEKYLERNLTQFVSMMSEATRTPSGQAGPDWGSAVDPENGDDQRL